MGGGSNDGYMTVLPTYTKSLQLQPLQLPAEGGTDQPRGGAASWVTSSHNEGFNEQYYHYCYYALVDAAVQQTF